MKKFRTKMRKTLKGGVCLALAVCMMIAFIPATGATEAETTTAPTYEYVFSMNNLSPAATSTNYTIAKVLEAGAKFEDSEKKYSWQPLGVMTCTSSAFFQGGYRWSEKTSNSTRMPLGKNGTVIKITVGESGKYKPYISYCPYQYGGNINVYLSDYPYEGTNQPKSYVQGITGVSTSSISCILSGSFNTYDSKADTEFAIKKTEDFGVSEILLEKDKSYYLVISLDGERTAENYTEIPTTYQYHLYSFGLTKVETATDELEEVTENISFVATSNVGEKDMMNVEGFEYNDFTDSIPVGTFVEVTAPEKPGYEFKHWVRGSADNGVYVSDNPAYSFTALTHTFLTAIYENVSNEDDDAVTVEFYNGNGQYLDKAVSTVGGTVSVPDKAKAPAMTGFEFANQWRTEDGVFDASAPLAKKLTRAVAQFNTPSTTFTITCGEEEVPLTYGSKHTFTSNNPVYWMRDNTVVDYGTSYTHAAWDTTEITTSETGELVPVVVLDDTKKDGAYMIEYNAAGKEILEVGIVFGSDGVNIGSCSSKATSQYKNQHGQFTAKPYSTETTARGYMIYEEGNTYKVVYSK